MKVGIFCESQYDALAVRVLVDRVLGRATEPPSGPPLQARSWPRFQVEAAVVCRALHFGSDADGLVVVADSDASPVHSAAHLGPDPCAEHCRLCILRATLAETLGRVS